MKLFHVGGTWKRNLNSSYKLFMVNYSLDSYRDKEGVFLYYKIYSDLKPVLIWSNVWL